MNSLRIIGRAELVSFHELGLTDLKFRVDTGAFTSSLHCSQIERINDRVQCIFLDEKHPLYTGKPYEFELIKELDVRSSNGIKEKRCLVKTQISLFDQTEDILLTLTDRSAMKYPGLLGRRFLTGKYIVDVNQKYTSSL